VFGLPVAGADALVSSVGAAACGRIGWLKAGFGYRWETGELAVMAGGACDVGSYSPPAPLGANPPAAAVSNAAAARTFRLSRSDDGVVLRLKGSTGAPKFTLSGPGGLSVTTPSEAGAPLANDEFVVMQDEGASTTIVAVRRPAGTWTVTPQEGSQVTSLEQASIGAEPSVTAAVRGPAHQPKLTWKLAARAGQTVTFVEEGEQVNRVITTTADAKGAVGFTPADGPAGSRNIVAIVAQDGLPRLRTTVASYEAPDPDAELPGELPARKRLGELRRSVVGAGLDKSLQRRLVGPLRAARRALRPPAPDVATACARLGDFVVAVEQATGPTGIPSEQAGAWIDTADDVKRLLRCS